MKKINIEYTILSGNKKEKKLLYSFYIKDITHHKCSLIGIYSSLYYLITTTNFQNILSLTIDMPLLTKKSFTTLLNINKAYNSICYVGNQFPLRIKITKKNLVIVKNLVKNNKFTIKKMLITLQTKKIKNKPQHNKLLFINMNTPKDWYLINKIVKINKI